MKFRTTNEAILAFGSVTTTSNNLNGATWAQAQVDAWKEVGEPEWFAPSVLPAPWYIPDIYRIPSLRTHSGATITPITTGGLSEKPIIGFSVNLHRVSIEQAGRLLDRSGDNGLILVFKDGTHSPVHSSNPHLETHLQESIRRTIRDVLPQDITKREEKLLESLSSSLARRVLRRLKESPGWR